MILVFGALSDGGIGHLLHRLIDRRLPFLLLDPRQHGRDFHLSWELDGGELSGSLRYGERSLDLSGIAAVYVHLWPGADARYAGERRPSAGAYPLLRSFLDVVPVPVCNRPRFACANGSKTYQQQLIRESGFAVPRTLVTNLPGDAAAFFDACRGRVIYKSLSARRSVVTRMTQADLGRLQLLLNGPVQFQEWLPGTDVRVHVMGGRAHATEISAQVTDYRFGSREGKPPAMRGIVLDDELTERCLRLTASLGLIAAGVDLRHGLDGRWYCLEVNPTPAFAYYEQFTGQRIADALIDALLDAAAARATQPAGGTGGAVSAPQAHLSPG